jgi:DNA-binding transcriptional LysR family regulator
VLYGVLPELIRELRGDDSQVEVGLTEMITVQQLKRSSPGGSIWPWRLTFNDPAIVQQVVMAETLVAAIPARRPPPTPVRRRRAGPPAADPLSGPATAQLRRSCAVAVPRPGLQPRVVQEANELQTALGLVAAGLGITLVPSSVQRLHRDDVRYVPINAPGFVSPVIMSYRSGDTSPYLARAVAWVLQQA